MSLSKSYGTSHAFYLAPLGLSPVYRTDPAPPFVGSPTLGLVAHTCTICKTPTDASPRNRRQIAYSTTTGRCRSAPSTPATSEPPRPVLDAHSHCCCTLRAAKQNKCQSFHIKSFNAGLQLNGAIFFYLDDFRHSSVLCEVSRFSLFQDSILFGNE